MLKVLSEALIPKVITHSVIESYVRRALHHKIWFKLSKVERALLKAASKVVRVVRSKVLAEVLKRIFLIILTFLLSIKEEIRNMSGVIPLPIVGVIIRSMRSLVNISI